MSKKNNPPYFYHRFLDEAGDTTFFGKGKVPIIGKTDGVSLCFILGMVKFKSSLPIIRDAVVNLIHEVTSDPYYMDVASLKKKMDKRGFFFHATDDIPEIREKFFRFIKSLEVSFEAYVGRKIYQVFYDKHNQRETEFFADLLSHLIKNKFSLDSDLILNISARAASTNKVNLDMALEKAKNRFAKVHPDKEIRNNIRYNVQNPLSEPLLSVPDYFCWAIQRVFEKGDMRYYNYLSDKISLVVDLYDRENYENHRNYYNERNPMTANNKISPP